MGDYWKFPCNKSKVMLEHPFVSDVPSITLLSSKNPFCTEWMKTNGALRLMTWLSESRTCVFQVPTGGVPVVHRNTTWSDRSVWFQAGWGGDHPVHSGASISILWGKFWQEKVTDSILVSLNLNYLIISNCPFPILHLPKALQMGIVVSQCPPWCFHSPLG